MGFSLEEIQDSLVNQKYNDVMAAYLLLDYRNSEVTALVIPLKWRKMQFLASSRRLVWALKTPVAQGTCLVPVFYPRRLLNCPQTTDLFFRHQLEEGCIKPRPGSEVSNINAPSPPHKVQ